MGEDTSGTGLGSERVSRVLVVLLGSLGDVARGLALASEIKRSKRFELTWLVESKSLGLVEQCLDVDRIVEFRRADGFLGVCAVLRELSARNFDITIDLQRHLKSGLFSLGSRAPRRIGFSPQNTKEFNHWFNTEYLPVWHTERQVFAEGDDGVPLLVSDVAASDLWRSTKLGAYLSVLPLLGLPIPERPLWRFKQGRFKSNENSTALSEAGNSGENAGRVGLVLGSSWESKDWPGNEQLCRALSDHPRVREIVLLGDRSHVERGKALTEINSSKVRSTAGQLSLEGLLIELSRCQVVVGPDSGPGHLAGALGIPYIGLFGPTSLHLTAPFGLAAAIEGRVGCAPCYRRVCPGLGGICMRLISPAAVMERIESVAGWR